MIKCTDEILARKVKELCKGAKPVILKIKHTNYWNCTGCRFFGLGTDPASAFKQWQANMMSCANEP